MEKLNKQNILRYFKENLLKIYLNFEFIQLYIIHYVYTGTSIKKTYLHTYNLYIVDLSTGFI